MFEYFYYVWEVYDNLGTLKRIFKVLKAIKDNIYLYLKNPEVVLSASKVYVLKDIPSLSINELYEKISKEIEVISPRFTKEFVIFDSKVSDITFEIKLDKSTKHILLESKNYIFFPFRNSYRIKKLKEDLRKIGAIIIENTQTKLKNELLTCKIKIENVKNKDKIEFLFDECIIITKNNVLQINNTENKEYEVLIKAVVSEWFSKVM